MGGETRKDIECGRSVNGVCHINFEKNVMKVTSIEFNWLQSASIAQHPRLDFDFATK